MIFITGATGFLGAHLAYALLRKGSNIRALKRASSDLACLEGVFTSYGQDEKKLITRIEWVEGDLSDIHVLYDALDGVTDVYHCAALVSFNPLRKKELMKTNVQGTANLVDACLEKGIRRLCHVSSIGALGSSDSGEAVDELTPRKNSAEHSAYSQSKYFSELEVWRGIAEGLDAVIVNPGVILGPGDMYGSMGKFFKMVRKGLNYYPPGSNGYVDVHDVVNAMLLLMELPDSGERYVLVSENTSFKDLLAIMAAHLGKKPPVRRAGKSLLSFVSSMERFISVFSGRPGLLSRDLVRILSSTSRYSSDKLTSKTGYVFLPVETTVNELCRSFDLLKS